MCCAFPALAAEVASVGCGGRLVPSNAEGPYAPSSDDAAPGEVALRDATVPDATTDASSPDSAYGASHDARFPDTAPVDGRAVRAADSGLDTALEVSTDNAGDGPSDASMDIADDAPAADGAPDATPVESCSEVDDGTLCGGSTGICCAGACATCITTSGVTEVCTTSNACAVSCNEGLTLCGSSCVDPSSDPNACGASCEVCTAGLCFSSRCSDVYGFPIPFSPCDLTLGTLPAGVLIGEAVILPTMTVSAFGVAGTSNGVIDMALYTSVDGSPSNLLTETGSTGIGAGPNLLFTDSIAVEAGVYWVIVEFPSETIVCASSTTGNVVALGSGLYGPFPSDFPLTRMFTGPEYNFSVIGY
jgi:hypothetical protein